jgi:hypothetical protein
MMHFGIPKREFWGLRAFPSRDPKYIFRYNRGYCSKKTQKIGSQSVMYPGKFFYKMLQDHVKIHDTVALCIY